jgi:hypothetical protein
LRSSSRPVTPKTCNMDPPISIYSHSAGHQRTRQAQQSWSCEGEQEAAATEGWQSLDAMTVSCPGPAFLAQGLRGGFRVPRDPNPSPVAPAGPEERSSCSQPLNTSSRVLDDEGSTDTYTDPLQPDWVCGAMNVRKLSLSNRRQSRDSLPTANAPFYYGNVSHSPTHDVREVALDDVRAKARRRCKSAPPAKRRNPVYSKS